MSEYDRDRHVMAGVDEFWKPSIPARLRGTEDTMTDTRRRVFVTLEIDSDFAEWAHAHRGHQVRITTAEGDLQTASDADLITELQRRL